MYISSFWIFVIIVIIGIAYMSHRNSIRKTYQAYLEQREITSVYIDIARKNSEPNMFAKHLVFRLIHEAEVSNENLFSILSDWGVSEQVATILSGPSEDEDLRNTAEIAAREQITAHLSARRNNV